MKNILKQSYYLSPRYYIEKYIYFPSKGVAKHREHVIFTSENIAS